MDLQNLNMTGGRDPTRNSGKQEAFRRTNRGHSGGAGTPLGGLLQTGGTSTGQQRACLSSSVWLGKQALLGLGVRAEWATICKEPPQINECPGWCTGPERPQVHGGAL